MLRFDMAITLLSNLKSNLLVSFNVNTCGLDVLLFFEFISIVSYFYNDLIKLLYIFLSNFF